MVSQHLTAMLVVCRYSVGQRNLYDKILNRSSHNKVLRQKLLFYLVVFEFLVNFSYNQSLFLWWYRVQIFTLLICTILSLENVSEKQDLCFHKFSEKSSKLTHHLAIDKLKTYPKIIEKQVCKKSKSAKKSAKIKKQVWKKSEKSQQKKSAYSKAATTSLQNKKSKSAKSLLKVCKKSLHTQKLQQQVCKIKKRKSAKSLLKVCKKVCIFKKMQQQVCKNKKSKSSKKSAKSLQKVCIFKKYKKSAKIKSKSAKSLQNKNVQVCIFKKWTKVCIFKKCNNKSAK